MTMFGRRNAVDETHARLNTAKEKISKPDDWLWVAFDSCHDELRRFDGV